MQEAILKLPTSESRSIPEKWQPKYILKRIGEENIIISQLTRDEILRQLSANGRFIQIGEYTIMLNSIKSIDPFWGASNIPPRPKEELSVTSYDDTNNTATSEISNKEEIALWDELFGNKHDHVKSLFLLVSK